MHLVWNICHSLNHILNIKEKDIYMNKHRRAKAQECQDYSKCDYTDETARGWWAYDRQVIDSAVSNAQHEYALHNTAEAESYSTKTEWFQSRAGSLVGSQTSSMEPWGNPPGEGTVSALFLMSQTRTYSVLLHTEGVGKE